MNEKNTRYLIGRYPVLYQGHKLPITENLMSFGFECGNGWFKLIDQLSSDITELDKKEGTTTVAFQVKEKFGGVRFYVGCSTDAAFAAIMRAEEKSLVTCDVCGEPGKQQGKGWIYTMCDTCWKEMEKRNV